MPRSFFFFRRGHRVRVLRDKRGRFKTQFRRIGIKTVFKRKFLSGHGKDRKWREVRITRFSSKTHAPKEKTLRKLILARAEVRNYFDPPGVRTERLEAFESRRISRRQALREGLSPDQNYIEDYSVREEGY